MDEFEVYFEACRFHSRSAEFGEGGVLVPAYCLASRRHSVSVSGDLDWVALSSSTPVRPPHFRPTE